jgi:hypothetical protein
MNLKKTVTVITLFIIALGSFTLLFPGVRNGIIYAAETILNETLFREFWFLFLRNMAFVGFLFFAVIFFVTMTQSGKVLTDKCFSVWKLEFKSFIKKEYLIVVIILSVIYFLFIIGIIRANFYYNDDLDKALKGYRGGAIWGRYIPDFLSIIFHMNLKLNDISPFYHLIVVFLLSATTLIFLKIFVEGKITFSAIIASIPLGLSPYLLEPLSFRFDTFHLLLPVIFSVIPFLFYRNIPVYSVTSFFCLLAMCMSYQAASGIYIVMTAIIACKLWMENKTSYKGILAFVFSSIAIYVISLLLFMSIFYVSIPNYDHGHVSTSVFPISLLFQGIISNSINIIGFILADFKNNLLSLLIPLSIVLFILTNVIITKRNRILTFSVMLVFVPFIFIFSYGAYIVLEKPLWLPRAFIGFGFLLAAFLTYCVTMVKNIKSLKVITVIFAFLISYNFLIIGFTYGNALERQKDYQNFRTTLLITDINRSLDIGVEKPVIYIKNNIGFSPVIENMSVTIPLIKRIVYVALSGGSDWGHLPLHHYRFIHENDYGQNGENEAYYESFPLLVDNGYHTIRGDGESFFVTLK